MTRRFLDTLPLPGRVKKIARALLLENLGLKALAALITVLLWLSVASQPMAETIIREPISFQNRPAGLSIIEQEIDTAQLTLRGPRDVLSRIRAGEIHVDPIVDLSAYADRPGKRIITLSSDKISAPANIEVLEIKPARFSITLAKIVEKSIPVEPFFEGEPLPGYALAGYRLEPATVQIKGPQNHIEQIDRVHTETILLSGNANDFVVQAGVDVRDSTVEVNQTAVKVFVKLARVVAFDDLPIMLEPAEKNLATLPATVRVELEGEEAAIKNLTRDKIKVTVDPRQMSADRQAAVKVTLPAELTDKIRVKQIAPERITIKNR